MSEEMDSLEIHQGVLLRELEIELPDIFLQLMEPELKGLDGMHTASKWYVERGLEFQADRDRRLLLQKIGQKTLDVVRSIEERPRRVGGEAQRRGAAK